MACLRACARARGLRCGARGHQKTGCGRRDRRDSLSPPPRGLRSLSSHIRSDSFAPQSRRSSSSVLGLRRSWTSPTGFVRLDTGCLAHRTVWKVWVTSAASASGGEADGPGLEEHTLGFWLVTSVLSALAGPPVFLTALDRLALNCKQREQIWSSFCPSLYPSDAKSN